MIQIRKRNQNRRLRKICDCPRRKWAKCPHSWHFNFKPKGAPGYRFSVDSEAGKHIEPKGEAEALADNWRTAIRAGTFRRAHEIAPVETVAASNVVTLEKFGKAYFERRGKPANAGDRSYMARLVAFTPDGGRVIGQMALTDITEDTIELFFAKLRAEGRAASTRNKYVQLVKAMFGLIIEALETGCRKGELLSLTWRDVNLEKKEITVRAELTKTKTGRVLPISARLAAVLEMAKTAIETFMDDGPTKNANPQERAAFLASCYVFGGSATLSVRGKRPS